MDVEWVEAETLHAIFGIFTHFSSSLCLSFSFWRALFAHRARVRHFLSSARASAAIIGRGSLKMIDRTPESRQIWAEKAVDGEKEAKNVFNIHEISTLWCNLWVFMQLFTLLRNYHSIWAISIAQRDQRTASRATLDAVRSRGIVVVASERCAAAGRTMQMMLRWQNWATLRRMFRRWHLTRAFNSPFFYRSPPTPIRVVFAERSGNIQSNSITARPNAKMLRTHIWWILYGSRCAAALLATCVIFPSAEPAKS